SGGQVSLPPPRPGSRCVPSGREVELHEAARHSVSGDGERLATGGAREEWVTGAEDDGDDRYGERVDEVRVEGLTDDVAAVDVDVAPLGGRARFDDEVRDRSLHRARGGNLRRERAACRDEHGAVFVGPASEGGDRVVRAPSHEQRADACEDRGVSVIVALDGWGQPREVVVRARDEAVERTADEDAHAAAHDAPPLASRRSHSIGSRVSTFSTPSSRSTPMTVCLRMADTRRMWAITLPKVKLSGGVQSASTKAS